MKRLILTFLATVGIAVVLPATTFAAPNAVTGAKKTYVTGTVRDKTTHKVVKNAKVTVTCKSTVKHTTTNSSGVYLVQFNAKKCPNNSWVTVKAVKGSLNGTSSGNVSKVTANINIAIVDVVIPEFGLAAAFGAAGVAAAGFLVMRRRKLGSAIA